jgi:hypothetical protein
VLAYFFRCSKDTGRVIRTVTLALSVGFIGPPSSVSRDAGVLERDDKKPTLPEKFARSKELQAIISWFGKNQIDQTKNNLQLFRGIEEVYTRLVVQHGFTCLLHINQP